MKAGESSWPGRIATGSKRVLVRTAIEEELDRTLPEAYGPDLFEQKVAAIYQHIYDSYYDQGRSIYGPAA